MVKILIGSKYYVRHLNEKFCKIFSGLSGVCQISSIQELLTVFEDPAQYVRTIVVSKLRRTYRRHFGFCYV